MVSIVLADFPSNMTAGDTYTSFFDITNSPDALVFFINKTNPTIDDFKLSTSLNNNLLSCNQDILEWQCLLGNNGILELSLILNMALEPGPFTYTIYTIKEGEQIPVQPIYNYVRYSDWVPPGGMCRIDGCSPGYECIIPEGKYWGACIRKEISFEEPSNETKIVNITVEEPFTIGESVSVPQAEEDNLWIYMTVIGVLILIVIFYWAYKKYVMTNIDIMAGINQ